MKTLYMLFITGLVCIGVVLAATWTMTTFQDHTTFLIRGSKITQVEQELSRALPNISIQSYIVNGTHGLIYIPSRLSTAQIAAIVEQLTQHVPNYQDEDEQRRLAYEESNLTYYMNNYDQLPLLQQRKAIKMLINFTVRKLKK